MREVCKPEMADEALQMVRDRPTVSPTLAIFATSIPPVRPIVRRDRRRMPTFRRPETRVSSVGGTTDPGGTTVATTSWSLTSPPAPRPSRSSTPGDGRPRRQGGRRARRVLPPYKPAAWPEFLRAALGAAAAARLLDAPASPVASPRRRLASPVASPVASPHEPAPRRSSSTAAAVAAPAQPTALDASRSPSSAR